jgi:hypothetical protein
MGLRSKLEIKQREYLFKVKEYKELEAQIYQLLKEKSLKSKHMTMNQSVMVSRSNSMKSVNSNISQNSEVRQIQTLQTQLDKESGLHKKSKVELSELKQKLSSKENHLKHTQRKLKGLSKDRKMERRKLLSEIDELKKDNYTLKRNLKMLTHRSAIHHDENMVTFGKNKDVMFQSPEKVAKIRGPYKQISDTEEMKDGYSGENKLMSEYLQKRRKLLKNILYQKITHEIRTADKKLQDISNDLIHYKCPNRQAINYGAALRRKDISKNQITRNVKLSICTPEKRTFDYYRQVVHRTDYKAQNQTSDYINQPCPSNYSPIGKLHFPKTNNDNLTTSRSFSYL